MSCGNVPLKRDKVLLFCVIFCIDACSSMYYLTCFVKLQTVLSTFNKTFNKTFTYQRLVACCKIKIKPLCAFVSTKDWLTHWRMFCFWAECIRLCCKFKCTEIKQNQTLLSYCLSVNEQ